MKKLLLQLRIWLLRIARPDKIMYIGGSDTLPQPLSRTEEAQLIAQMDQGDFSVRQTLIERNLRLVVYLARRFENTGVNMEDLISIGTIGLIKAINTFRADKAGHLCLPLHRKRDSYVSTQKLRPADGNQL